MITPSKENTTAAHPIALYTVAQHIAILVTLRSLAPSTKISACSTPSHLCPPQSAARSIVVNSARAGTLRGAVSLLGPISWAWLATDLAMKSIGTDYARITQAVCLLAQVRLLRTHGWEPPESPRVGGPPVISPQRLVDVMDVENMDMW